MKPDEVGLSKRAKVLRTIVLVWYILIISLFLIWLPSFSLITFIRYFREDAEKERSSNVLNEYQYLRYDSTTDEATFGMVKKREVLEGDRFLSYQDQDDKLILVSNFESEEFICTGSCYCSSSERRIATARKGLKYLVAAASSLVAVQFARRHFQEECENSDFSRLENCPIDSVQSEVGYCESVAGKKKSKAEGLLDWNEYDTRVNFVDPTTLRMICKGNCILERAGRTREQKELFFQSFSQESNPCVELKKIAVVDIYLTSTMGPEEVGYKDYEGAREKFRDLYLRDFCRQQRISLNRLMRDEGDQLAKLRFRLEEEDRMKNEQYREHQHREQTRERTIWGEIFGYGDENDHRESREIDESEFDHQYEERQRQERMGDIEGYRDMKGDVLCGEGSKKIHQNIQCRRIRNTDKL